MFCLGDATPWDDCLYAKSYANTFVHAFVLIGFSDLVCGFLKLSILMPLLSGSHAVSTMEVSLNGLAYSKYLAEC